MKQKEALLAATEERIAMQANWFLAYFTRQYTRMLQNHYGQDYVDGQLDKES